MARSAPVRSAVVAATTAALLLLPACSDDEPDSPDATAPTSAAPDEGPVVKVREGVVAGTLARKPQRETVTAVGAVVEGWVGAAYPQEGTAPDLAAALGSFTADAARQARRTKGAWGAGEGAAVRAAVKVDVLSPRRRISGATARVAVLVQTPDGSRDLVSGRLLLSPVKRGWQVFAFDLDRGAARKGARR